MVNQKMVVQFQLHPYNYSFTQKSRSVLKGLSKIFKKWKTRHCSEINYDDRVIIFNTFWKELTSCQERNIIIQTSVEKIKPKQRRNRSVVLRRKRTYLYYLQIGDCKLCVCRNMFLNMFGLKNSTLKY